MKNQFDTIIVGGGAAGVFAAINIAIKNPNQQIAILEKSSKLLSKVKVSGGGRCNVTHACFEPKELAKFYPRGQKELIGPFHQFQPGDVIAWFADRGIELKIEDDGRMFPVTDDSQTIIDCFLKEIQQNNIEIIFNTKVESIEKMNECFELITSENSYNCNNLIITTGGSNKPEAYNFISALGHTIISPNPSLFTFNLPNNDILQLQGLVSNVEVKIEGTKLVEQGSLLITHWGMSGPAILKLSAWGARILHEKNYNFQFSVNWLPKHSIESVIDLLNSYKIDFSSKKISNEFNVDIPKKLKWFLVQKAGINPDTKWAEVSKQQLHQLAETLTRDSYQSQGKTTFKQEFVTCGGVQLNEINFKTFESKLVPNLYFAGEVLDIDALTGGFNFQAAWTGAWIISEQFQ